MNKRTETALAFAEVLKNIPGKCAPENFIV